MKKILAILMLSQGLNAAPLHDAIKTRDINAVRLLIESGANVNERDNDGKTPLHIAIKAQNPSIIIIDLLLERNVDVNVVDDFGNTQIHRLAKLSLHRAQRLLQTNAGQNFNRAIDRYTSIETSLLIITIALLGSDRKFLFLRPITNVLEKSKFVTHALRSICYSHLLFKFVFYRIPIALLFKGLLRINTTDIDGRTPLHYAAIQDNPFIVIRLINSLFCDHTIIDNYGYTPEDIARSQGNQLITDMLHNALTVRQKILKSEKKGLQLFAANAVNKKGITQTQLESLAYNLRPLITNIIEDDGEPDPSGYHSDDELSSMATEDLEDTSSVNTEDLEHELEQQQYCSIQ